MIGCVERDYTVLLWCVAGEGTVAVSVPVEASGDLLLETVTGGGQTSRGCEVRTAAPLRLVGPVRDVIIRPWSQYYKPGETGTSYTPFFSTRRLDIPIHHTLITSATLYIFVLYICTTFHIAMEPRRRLTPEFHCT